MIKKIKITNHSDAAVRDTTIGQIYNVNFCKEGEVDIAGDTCLYDTLCLIDDVGDKVAFWTHDGVYEVVEEDLSMTNNNRVNWDEIPEDVEAVVTYLSISEPNYYKASYGKLMCQRYRHEEYALVGGTLADLKYKHGDRFHLRPSPITKPTLVTPESTQVESSEVDIYDIYKEVALAAAEVDKINNDIYKEAAINFKPDADMYDIFKGVDSKPSISTILQEAQQSILKHHGVTGEVKFTVTCS